MTGMQSILLGALQGLAEFLPVSSSGHLVLARQIMKVGPVPPLFDVILHLATLLVVILVFRTTLGRLLAVLIRFLMRRSTVGDRKDLRFIAVLLTATLLTALAGGGFSLLDVEEHPRAVSLFFLLTGGILLFSRKFSGTRRFEDLRLRDGIITGLAQGIGVLPGVSRSGITISAALGVRMDRPAAGEFSFLLSVPAVLGALLLELKDLGTLARVLEPQAMLGGFLAAAAAGFVSLTVLLRLIRRGRLYLFAFYLFPLGLAGLLFL